MKRKKENHFIQDMILTDSDNDFFGHKDLAKNIAEIITNEYYKAPYNIALIGKWGLGKSSLLNFVQKQVSKDCEVFTINAWKYEKESLKKKFLKSIYEEIKGKKISTFDMVSKFVTSLLDKQKVDKTPFWKTSTGKKTSWFIFWVFIGSIVYSFITGNINFLANQKDYATLWKNGIVVNLWKSLNYYFSNLSENFLLPLFVGGVGLCVVNILDKIKTPINIELPITDADDYETLVNTEIDYLIKKKKINKVIVIIDDLDRLSTSKIVEALDTLKSLMEIKNCIFIVPFDDTLIKNALEKNVISQVDSEHQTIKSELILDKLFQFKFYLAPLIRSDIKNYTIETIRKEAPGFVKMFTADSVDHFDEIMKNTVIYNGLETPRQIKKIVNVLSNNLLILNERCKFERTENNLLNKDGLLLISKLSVLQADFNDFFDTLFVKDNNIDYLLNYHKVATPYESIPYELKFLFEKKNESFQDETGSIKTLEIARIKKEHEVLINFLMQTRNISHKKITAYLYLNQDKLSVKYGSEFNQRITDSIESANVTTSLELVKESKTDLNELLIEILEETQQENLSNTLISLYGISKEINNINLELLTLLSKKTSDYYKVSESFDDIKVLDIKNLMFVYNQVVPENSKGTEKIVCSYLDNKFHDSIGKADELIETLNIILESESSLNSEIKKQIKKSINEALAINKTIDIDSFINKVNLFSKTQYTQYLSIDFFKNLCAKISETESMSKNEIEWLKVAKESLVENSKYSEQLFEELSKLYKYQGNIKTLNSLILEEAGEENE